MEYPDLFASIRKQIESPEYRLAIRSALSSELLKPAIPATMISDLVAKIVSQDSLQIHLAPAIDALTDTLSAIVSTSVLSDSLIESLSATAAAVQATALAAARATFESSYASAPPPLIERMHDIIESPYFHADQEEELVAELQSCSEPGKDHLFGKTIKSVLCKVVFPILLSICSNCAYDAMVDDAPPPQPVINVHVSVSSDTKRLSDPDQHLVDSCHGILEAVQAGIDNGTIVIQDGNVSIEDLNVLVDPILDPEEPDDHPAQAEHQR